MADFSKGALRAALGQGLGMGWGDEAEAWLRERMGEGPYEQNLKRIRGEQAEFSAEHPFVSGTLEFAGGAAPGVAAMLIPGMQVAGAQQLGRTGLGALAKLSALGATSGAVAGAGSATEGRRGAGAATGATIGAALGPLVPAAIRGGTAATRWTQERFLPTQAVVAERAAGKMNKALGEANLAPQEIERLIAADRSMGVPSVVANVSPATAELAEAVAQRTGRGARNVEKALTEQKLGARERAYSQAVKALKPGDYYDDLAKLQTDLRTKAAPLYEAAYKHGEVSNPDVLQFLQLPQFQAAMGEAKKLLAAEGREFDASKPTVEVLDQVKRGLDALIEKETDAVTGKMTSLGRVYANKKREFLGALDEAVPQYKQARAVYAGDAELLDSMRAGLNEFRRTPHEEVLKRVAAMSPSERDAYRTGVARALYDEVMGSSNNINAAQRLIGSPEMRAKLQQLFDNPAQFKLFATALEREAQLFQQANRVLGGSQTGKRIQMREELEGSPGFGEAVGQALTGGFWSSLTGVASRAIRNSAMPEKTAEKLSTMLMAKDPNEVAAVVKLLEEQAAGVAPKALRAGKVEAGGVTGVGTAITPSPAPERPERSIEQETGEQAPKLDDSLHELMLK